MKIHSARNDILFLFEYNGFTGWENDVYLKCRKAHLVHEKWKIVINFWPKIRLPHVDYKTFIIEEEDWKTNKVEVAEKLLEGIMNHVREVLSANS